MSEASTERSSTSVRRLSPLHLAVAIVPLAVLLAGYLPDLGHGFIKDDFAWVVGSRIAGIGDVWEILSRHNGFYRPLVSLTFTLDEWLFGLDPLGYGLTNLLLVVACLLGIAGLARALGLPWAYGWLAGCVWALNPHGVSGAIMWISGRTSLLVTLFAVLAAAAYVSGRRPLGLLCCLLALLSKEEAALLPAILVVWDALGREKPTQLEWRRAARSILVLSLPLIGYLALRSRTEAFLPWTAPASYTATFSPIVLARNVLEYLDRSCTFAAAIALVASLVVWRLPRPCPKERRWLLLCAAWFAGAFGLTLFLPVRSSLYACFPSVGSAIAAAVLVRSSVGRASPRRAAFVAPILMALSVPLIPLYRSRNVRMVKLAELSSQLLRDVRYAADARLSDTVLVIQDAVGDRSNVASAFGTLIQEAVRLATDMPNARVWVEPPLPGWAAAGLQPPPDEQRTLRYALVGGRLVVEASPGARQPESNRPQ